METGLRGHAALGELADLEPLGAKGEGSVPTTPPAAEVGVHVAEARRRRGLTGERLGGLVGLEKDQISKIEHGLRRISARELPKFADALGVSIGFLLGRPAQPRMALAQRLAAGAAPDAVAATRQRAVELLAAEDVLTQRTDLRPAGGGAVTAAIAAFSRTDLARNPRNAHEAQRQGRRMAEQVRTLLGLGGNEIGDLAGLIERAFGVDVALSPLGTGADGLCVHSDGVALIVASSDFPDGHVRFTLAHELGHHLFVDPRDVIDESQQEMLASGLAERRVNAFAGHLLMPEPGVRETLVWVSDGVVNERALVALMERFGVSLQALVVQLVMLKLISFEEGQRLRDCRVGDLVARHRDVAPSQAATTVRGAIRVPERLLGEAVRAAQARRIGLSVVASLLQRDDDDALWDEVMASQADSEAGESRPGRAGGAAAER